MNHQFKSINPEVLTQLERPYSFCGNDILPKKINRN